MRTQSPNKIMYLEPATGLLVKGIKVNGHYLAVNSCNVQLQQEFDVKYYIQGGSRPFIADIGNKWIEGNIRCQVRVDENGNLEPAVKELLLHAETPEYPLRIDTNYAVTYYDLLVCSNDENELISFNCCAIRSLELSTDKNSGVMLNVGILGMMDGRNQSDFIAPENDLLYRHLSFTNCKIERFKSQMRNVTSFKLNIENKVDKLYFLMSFNDPNYPERYDQPHSIGVSECKWYGSYEEMLRKGFETDTYMHGGFEDDHNLILTFGKIQAIIPIPLFKTSQQEISPSLIKRTTEFISLNPPAFHQSKLFNFL